MSEQKKQTIFGIADDFDALWQMLEEAEGNITGVEDVVEQFMQELQQNLADKADRYAYIIADSLARSSALKEEKKRVEALAKSYENKAERLKDLLMLAMNRLGRDTLETANHKFRIQANGGVQALGLPEKQEDIDKLPPEYLIPVTTNTINKELVRQDLEAGVEIPGAYIKPRGVSLRIK